MALIDSVATKGLNALGISTNATLKTPPGPDFPNGFRVSEFVNGVERAVNDGGYGFALVGPFMPHIPFEFGGEQKIVKDYYPGTKQPTVQVLGPQETDLTIKGRLYLKKLSNEKIDGASELAEAYQLQIDHVRLRGNLLKLEMGAWVRYGFLENVKFTLNRRVDIDYELKFVIVGFTKPVNGLFTADQKNGLKEPSDLLSNETLAALAAVKNYPSTMPRTLAQFLNDKIASVANVVALVTGFVDDNINDANNLLASANRALGMIKYARAYISKTIRSIGQIQHNASTLGSSFSSEAHKTSAMIRNAKFNNDQKAALFSLAAFLAALQKRYEGLAATLPIARHFVQDGDTLQKISTKFYGNPDGWKKIYDHNKLTSTILARGKVLEIPK